MGKNLIIGFEIGGRFWSGMIRHIVRSIILSGLFLLNLCHASDPLDTWFQRMSGTQQSLNRVTYGDNGTLVAVGNGGTILISADGVSWSNSVSGTDQSLTDVSYANNTFVAVGNGITLTSPNGIIWANQITNAPPLNCIAYGNETFVALGYKQGQKYLGSSPDGISWTWRTNTIGNKVTLDVTFANDSFVAVGSQASTLGDCLTGIVFYSTDGLTWTDVISSQCDSIRGVDFGGQLLVAVRGGGRIQTSTPSSRSWTNQISVTTNSLFGVGHGNNSFVAVGNFGEILTSLNGTSWTRRNSGTGNVLRGVAYANGCFVAVGDAGTILQSGNVIAQPPSITTASQSQSVAAGLNIPFIVEANGVPPLHYQWRKNGVNILDATNTILTLNSVGASASAGYSVVVTNVYGSAVSDTAYLSVLTVGGAPTSQPTNTPPALPPAEAGKDSLVFITHGRTPQGDSGEHRWVDDMKDAIKTRVPPNWMVIGHKWVADSRDPFSLPVIGPVTGVPSVALRAQIEGMEVGRDLAALAQLTPNHRWEHVHLIGHSAGAALIEEASRIIAETSPPSTTIHTTFLDAHSGVLDERRFDYGQYSDWADSYFATDSETHDPLLGRTDGALSFAHNVDVTWLDPGTTPITIPDANIIAGSTAPMVQQFSSHGWPYNFYLQSIPNGFPSYANYGFVRSKEGGGWNDRGSYKRGEKPVVLGGQPALLWNPFSFLVKTAIKVTLVPFAQSALGVTFFGFGGVGFDLSAGLSQLSPSVANNSDGPITQNGGPTPQDAGGGPAWLAVTVTVSNAVNFVQFDSVFGGTNGSEGLMTVYWNTNQIGVLDERLVAREQRTYRFALPGTITNGLYTLSFRLDSFNSTSSSVTVTNVATGLAGLDQPFRLDMVRTGSNNAPVLKLTGPSNYSYLMESSTNLLTWQPTALLLNMNGTVLYNDLAITNSSQKFYRAVAYSPVNLTSPNLAATRQGNSLVLSWNTNFVGFALEFATNLPPTSWTSNSVLPAIVNDRFIVTNSISVGSRFYRLKK